MLAEKFFLVLETLRSHTHADGSQRVTSTSRHVPMDLPNPRQDAPGHDSIRSPSA